MRTALNHSFGLAVFVMLSFAVAGVGGWFTGLSIDNWYITLRKPAWNPPNWIFGPVWTALYLSMAIAGWLVWRKRGLSHAVFPLSLFAVQLILNAAWSGFFFGLQSPKIAFMEIVLLWGAILATVVSFGRITALAGWLMVPYLLWVTFAAALNFTIWQLNA